MVIIIIIWIVDSIFVRSCQSIGLIELLEELVNIVAAVVATVGLRVEGTVGDQLGRRGWTTLILLLEPVL